MSVVAEFRYGRVSGVSSREIAEVWVPGQFMMRTLLMLFFVLPSMTRSL